MAEHVDWRHRAACRDEDPELFFPIGGNSSLARMQLGEATAVCNRCLVIDECLRWALETGQDAGVWGGMGEDERKALKKRQIRAKKVGKVSTKVVEKKTEYYRDGDF